MQEPKLLNYSELSMDNVSELELYKKFSYKSQIIVLDGKTDPVQRALEIFAEDEKAKTIDFLGYEDPYDKANLKNDPIILSTMSRRAAMEFLGKEIEEEKADAQDLQGPKEPPRQAAINKESFGPPAEKPNTNEGQKPAKTTKRNRKGLPIVETTDIQKAFAVKVLQDDRFEQLSVADVNYLADLVAESINETQMKEGN